MRKNLHGRILKEESKEQHLSIVHKSYSILFYVFKHQSLSYNFEPFYYGVEAFLRKKGGVFL